MMLARYERLLLTIIALIAFILAVRRNIVYLDYLGSFPSASGFDVRFSTARFHHPWSKMVLPLAINAAIIWTRKLTGLIVSILALTWVAFIYGAWFLRTANVESQMATGESPRFEWYTSTLGLSEASWHDLFILVIITTLFVWQLSKLAKSFLHRIRRDATDA